MEKSQRPTLTLRAKPPAETPAAPDAQPSKNEERHVTRMTPQQARQQIIKDHYAGRPTPEKEQASSEGMQRFMNRRGFSDKSNTIASGHAEEMQRFMDAHGFGRSDNGDFGR